LTHLIRLSQVETFPNSLAFLQNLLNTELGKCTLAMVTSLGLKDNYFQVSNYCNSQYCPNYSAAELLNPSSSLPSFHGEFIKQWKTMTNPLLVSKTQCSDLFQDNLFQGDVFPDKHSGYHDILVLPILLDLKVQRWILVLNSEHDINKVDLSKLMLLANFAVVSLARAEEKKQLQEMSNWRDQELKEIARLQNLLLPDVNTLIPGVELAFKFQVYKEAGGDYFDITDLSKGRENNQQHDFGVIIADVTGHGPSAAVEAAMLDAILRTYVPEPGEDDPAAVLDYINTHFFTRRSRGKFITAIIFNYDHNKKCLRYACAGHPYGYIKRGQQLLRLDKSEDIPIGVLKDYRWHNHEIDVLPQDIIFVYTDVVLETRNPQQQEFGFDRLEQNLLKAEHCPQLLVDDVTQALIDFNQSDEFCDDLTLCAIKITG
jgi:sigma-B regulation protein RsbU (phosphoserine phosphatase)